MLNSSICERLNVEFPLVAFTHRRDVVVEVSKAGRFRYTLGRQHAR